MEKAFISETAKRVLRNRHSSRKLVRKLIESARALSDGEAIEIELDGQQYDVRRTYSIVAGAEQAEPATVTEEA